MDEYIEREATIKLLRSLGSRDYRREKGTIQEAIKMVSFSEYTPAADVAPVRHGRWVPKRKVYRTPSAKNHTCSECGLEVAELWHYCPNCGAQMDGERKECAI